MSSSGQRTHLKLLTVGDFDPQTDRAIEYDFIGRVIAGRYTIQAHIGGGGMADVYRATDQQLGVDVAIKLLKPRMASDELRARMVQEAQAAAQVRHSNLVRVFGTGKLDATAYIVMELLDGPNLEQYLREYRDQRLPWREALALLLPALEALHAVHERGYVHRDIKTGNILVARPPGSPPTAIVIDLGLVKADRALRTVDSPPTTEIGRMLCTPGYTSPEQAGGFPVDRRADVYSMAVTLYRVLAGRLPFHDARDKPAMVVLTKHLYNEPTMLAEAAVGADIPPAIAAVIESALRKKPSDRPQTMLEFAEALRDAAAQVPVSPPRRRPHELLLALLLALGLGATLTWLAIPPATPVATPRPIAPAATSLASDPQPAMTPTPSTLPDGVEAPSPSRPDGIDAPPRASLPGTPDIRAAGATDLEPPQDPPTMGPEPNPDAKALAPRSPDPKAAARRALARHTADVQRCADLHTGSIERLAVTMNINTSGRVFAQAVGAGDSPLSRCLDAALKGTPIAAPKRPMSFVQVFKLRATPRRP
jgi:serine/threonine-protein kinase